MSERKVSHTGWHFSLYSFKVRTERIVNIISYCCILLFVYAAANKLLDYQKFKVQIGQSPILTSFADIIAWTIPSIEIIISLLLFFPKTLLFGLYACFSLMVIFTAYVFAILNFAERVPCSCGGILDKMGWHEHLVFNTGFVLLTLVGIVLQSKIQEHQKSGSI